MMLRNIATMALSLALVAVLAKTVAAQEVEPEPTADERPATVRVCVTSFDPETGIAGPDDVTSLDVQPPVADAATINVAGSDGCALLENVRGGTYTITIRTARGFTVTDDLTLAPGDNGTINLESIEPRPGQLPTTGSGGTDESGYVAMILALLAVACFATGALALVTTRRRRA